MALRRPRHGLPGVLDQPVLTARPWALLWLPRLLSDNTVLVLSSKVTRIFLLTLLSLTLHFFLSPSSLPSFILFSSFHWPSSQGSTSILSTHIFCLLVYCFEPVTCPSELLVTAITDDRGTHTINMQILSTLPTHHAPFPLHLHVPNTHPDSWSWSCLQTVICALWTLPAEIWNTPTSPSSGLERKHRERPEWCLAHPPSTCPALKCWKVYYKQVDKLHRTLPILGTTTKNPGIINTEGWNEEIQFTVHLWEALPLRAPSSTMTA